MALRVAVRETEAWILADKERIAAYLGVNANRLVGTPDTLPDPKEFLVNLARQSRKADIRGDMVPVAGSGQSVGPAYASRLIEFVQNAENGWRPNVAADSSESLGKCIAAIQRLSALPYPIHV